MAETQPDIAQYQTDHDLLVTLNERMRGFVENIRSLTEAMTLKNEDHEARLRAAEKAIESMRSSSATWRFVLSLTVSVVVAMAAWLFIDLYNLDSSLDKRINTAINTSLTNYSLIKK